MCGGGGGYIVHYWISNGFYLLTYLLSYQIHTYHVQSNMSYSFGALIYVQLISPEILASFTVRMQSGISSYARRKSSETLDNPMKHYVSGFRN